MRDAYLLGAGQSSFGAFPERSYRSLFREAYEETLAAAPEEFDSESIDEAVVGTLGVGGRQLGLSGPAVTEHVGLHGVPCTRVENACAAGGFAVRQAVQAVRSGMADVVLAGGYESMTDVSGDTRGYWLGVSGETEHERLAGTTFAGVYAQMTDAHVRAFGTTDDQLAAVSVKNHRHARMNPHAHLGFECSPAEVLEAPTVADPLTVYHCCPVSDGAACALVVSEDVARRYREDPVCVAGVGASSDHVGLYERDTYTSIPATRRAAQRAYDDAGVAVDDLDFAEVHDCFAIAELLAYGDLGFCDPADSGAFVERGETGLDGSLPVNTSGGLKAKGHPIGATGVGQVVEAFEQLTGRAGPRQVERPTVGLTHNVGGSGGAGVVHVFERSDPPHRDGKHGDDSTDEGGASA